ncbi:helix-turn-helix transcriptional regulator [bacterium]|nr:helix-turn-helix transcriptional regulator [bacterium]
MKVIESRNPTVKIVDDIKTGKLFVELTGDDDLLRFKELPPFVDFKEPKNKCTYKHLGQINTLQGENILEYSVRDKKSKRRHFTLVWTAIVKNDDIMPIKDRDYSMVNMRIQLSKSSIKSLKDTLTEFLCPTPKEDKSEPKTKLFEILRLPFALDLIRYFSENEELTASKFREITGLKWNKSYQYLRKFEEVGLLRSYRYGKGGIKNYKITLEKEKIKEIMNVIRD